MKKLIGLGLLLLALLPIGVAATDASSCPYMSGAAKCPYMSYAECATVCSPQLMETCQVRTGTRVTLVCQIDGQFCTGGDDGIMSGHDLDRGLIGITIL